MPLLIGSNAVLCKGKKYVANKPSAVRLYTFTPTKTDIQNIAHFTEDEHAYRYILGRARSQYAKFKREQRAESKPYEGKSFTDLNWRQAYDMYMPKRVLLYEQMMEELSKKIRFMCEMRRVVKKNELDKMEARIEELRRKHNKVLKAHDRAMKKVYASLTEKGEEK